jgi:hypothetical protein
MDFLPCLVSDFLPAAGLFLIITLAGFGICSSSSGLRHYLARIYFDFIVKLTSSIECLGSTDDGSILMVFDILSISSRWAFDDSSFYLSPYILRFLTEQNDS